MVKVAKFLIGAGALVSGLGLAPLSAARADSPPPLQGNVSSSTIDVSIAPSAILNGVPNLLGGSLNAAGLGNVRLKLDAASAEGLLTGARNDLASGKSSSQAVDINIAALDGLLKNLTNQIGALNTVPSTLSSLAPQLSTVVAGLTGPINGLLGTSSLNQAVSAILDAGHPQGSTQGVNGLNLSTGGVAAAGLPGLNLALAPFRATAVNAAGAGGAPGAEAGLKDPQAEAHSTTQSLALDQVLKLPTLPALTDLITTVQGAITTLTSAATAATVPGATIPTVVGILDGTSGGATKPVTGQAPTLPAAVTAVTDPVAKQVDTAPIANAVTTINATLEQLKALLGTLNGLVDLSGLSLNGLVSAEGVSSTSLLQPRSNGVHGIATSKFTDLKLLQIAPGKLHLPGLGGLPLAVDTPLLEIKGAQSSAEAQVDGTDGTAPTGTSKLGEIDVLGVKALDLNSAIAPGTSKSIPIGVPGTGLGVTLQVTAGVPVIANSSASHKSVQVGALEVALYNGAAGMSPIPLLGGAAGLASTGVLSHAQLAATGSNAIVKASFASSAVDAAAGPLSSTTAANPQAEGQLPKTGRFGPWALLIGAALVAIGLTLRLAPGAIGRLRRNRS